MFTKYAQAFDMTTNQKDILVEKIYRGIDPMLFFQPSASDIDFQGWQSDHPYLKDAVKLVKPQLIVEIGVWKGCSAITMAKECKRQSLDAVVVAIDTWLGSVEHWLDQRFYPSLKIKNGSPTIFETFMTNVCAASVADFVLPFRVDSLNGFQVLRKLGVLADVIHIDAGHDYDSVQKDISSWWTLLKRGGVMVVDDYMVDEDGNAKKWPDVKRAVDEHVQLFKAECTFKHTRGKAWVGKER